MLEQLLKWAGKQTGFNEAWSGGNWLERFGGSKFREDWDQGAFGKGFNEAWAGGNWLDRTGLRHSYDQTLGAFEKNWMAGEWWKTRMGGDEFEEAWGGDAWLKDRLGFGQFDSAEEELDRPPDTPEEDPDPTGDPDSDPDPNDTPNGGGGGNGGGSNTTVNTDAGLDDTVDDGKTDKDKKDEVVIDDHTLDTTLDDDPTNDMEILSPLGGDVSMSSYLAQRRRQIKNKKGRTDTMLTRGAYITDTDNRMTLS